MKPLKIGITGVRGIVGETFTPEVAVGFSQAFGTYLDGGRILVCRDTRASGPMVRAAVMAGLLAAGCEVIDLGVCPTPSLQLAVTWLQADASRRAPGHIPPGRVCQGYLGQDRAFDSTSGSDRTSPGIT